MAQRRHRQMSKGGLIALISLASAVPPVATDLFLPAITDMPSYFHTSEAVVNLLLMAFYLCLAIGMLVFGPLSDKHGRRPILLISTLLFTAMAFLCAAGGNIWLLIAERALQGVGGGGMIAMGTALVKDCFEGETRQRVLVATMAIGMVAPMAAPVLGALILMFTTWQGTFLAQGIFGLAALVFVLRLLEPLACEERVSEGLLHTFGRLVAVGKNPCFLILLLVAALNAGPYMAYISSASYIYVDFFGLSKLGYSAFFAANALMGILGALLVNAIQKRFAAKHSLGFALALAVLSGCLVLLVGPLSPFAFLGAYAIFTLIGGFVRPVATAVLLEQQERDTGSASSLINTSYSVFGSIYMVLATLPWDSYITGVGVLVAATSAVCLALFAGIVLSSLQVKGLD